jgi:hypothetical protein
MTKARKILIALIGLALTVPLHGAVQKEGNRWVGTEEGTLPAGSRLRVSAAGAISIQGEETEQVRYTVTKKVKAKTEQEAEQRLDAARVASTRQGNTVVLSLVGPGCKRCNFSADLHVVVPIATWRTVLNSQGGSLSVKNVKGLVIADTKGGSIYGEEIGQSVRASTAGGGITLQVIGGEVVCETAGGPISLHRGGSNATLTTSGGSISAQQIKGTVRAETAGGSITVKQVGGGLLAATSGGTIRLEDIAGRVTAETAGGSVHVSSAPGGVRAESAGGDIRLKGVAGAIIAENAAGDIEARFLAGTPLRDSVLQTNVGTIEVWLPVDLRVTVRAYVEMADSLQRIESDFADIRVRLEGDQYGPGSVTADGALNGGGPVLRINNTTGRIRIRRLP